MLPASFGLPDPPWIVAHRGASDDEPENTLASLLLGLEQRADMLELDVQLSRDGEIVAAHDWEVDLDGRSVVVEETDSDRLRGAGERDPRSPFPSLAEVLDAVPPEVPLNIELKRRRADRARLVRALTDRLGSRPRTLVSSFDWELLAELGREAPGLALAPVGSRKPHELLAAAETLDAASVHCHRRLAFDDFLTAARTARWPVLVYTVNRPEQARDLFDRGVAGVFTDLPGEMRQFLGLERDDPSKAGPSKAGPSEAGPSGAGPS